MRTIKVGDTFTLRGDVQIVTRVNSEMFFYQNRDIPNPRGAFGHEIKWAGSLKWDENIAPEHEDNLGIDPIKEAQKRILEKAIERLEGKKRCDSYLGYKWKNPCIACAEAGESERNGGDCVDSVIEEAIQELKSMM